MSKFTSSVGLVMFENISTPYESSNGPRYTMTLFTALPEDAQPLKSTRDAIIDAAKGEGWNLSSWSTVKGHAQLKIPFSTAGKLLTYGMDHERAGELRHPLTDEQSDLVAIKFSTKFMPNVKDIQGNDIDPAEIYPGCFVRVVGTAGAFKNSDARGICLFPDNIIKVRDGERLGGGGGAEVDDSDLDIQAADDPFAELDI